jgi:hypothetical protein
MAELERPNLSTTCPSPPLQQHTQDAGSVSSGVPNTLVKRSQVVPPAPKHTYNVEPGSETEYDDDDILVNNNDDKTEDDEVLEQRVDDASPIDKSPADYQSHDDPLNQDTNFKGASQESSINSNTDFLRLGECHLFAVHWKAR